MDFAKFLAIGCGGFIGAVSRYGLSGLAHRWWGATFPYGTLVVNVVGCLLLGGLMYLIKDRALVAPNMQLFLTVGLLGAFTTFSTFGYETIMLMRGRELTPALLNIGANVMLGLTAVWLGRTLLRLINP